MYKKNLDWLDLQHGQMRGHLYFINDQDFARHHLSFKSRLKNNDWEFDHNDSNPAHGEGELHHGKCYYGK